MVGCSTGRSEQPGTQEITVHTGETRTTKLPPLGLLVSEDRQHHGKAQRRDPSQKVETFK